MSINGRLLKLASLCVHSRRIINIESYSPAHCLSSGRLFVYYASTFVRKRTTHFFYTKVLLCENIASSHFLWRVTRFCSLRPLPISIGTEIKYNIGFNEL